MLSGLSGRSLGSAPFVRDPVAYTLRRSKSIAATGYDFAVTTVAFQPTGLQLTVETTGPWTIDCRLAPRSP